jgi:sulfotransferase family protein
MPARRTMPNFLVIGAMKAGTTSLYHYLREHPQIFMPKIKELDYFAVDESWARGPEWYLQQFAGSDGAAAVGEASTAYSKYPHYPNAPKRIARTLPDCRLIYVVRDPVERILSHYRHRVAVGAEREPIDRAVFGNPIYLDYTRYAMQLDRYLEHFDRERIRVVASEGLRHDRQVAVRSVYAFLGVDPDVTPETMRHEYYRTANRARFPAIAWSMRRAIRRRFPAAKRAKELVDSFGRSIRQHREPEAEAREDDPGAAMPDTLRPFIAHELRSDALRLRAFLGPEFDGWGL